MIYHSPQQQPSLVAPNDPMFLHWLQRNTLAFNSEGPKCPFAHIYHRALRKWEHIVQTLLGSFIESCPERILSYWRPNRNRMQRKHYREIDFVAGTRERPECFVEIKLRESVGHGKSGWSQLNASLDVAGQRWGKLEGLCINVAMAGVLKLDQLTKLTLTPIHRLRDFFESNTGLRNRTVWLNSVDVGEYALANGFLTVEELDRLPRLRAEMLHPTLAVESTLEISRARYLMQC